ncbi:hypothetical protein GC176_28025 [bacterium]|nr:hypothetical protein [bacterium]
MNAPFAAATATLLLALAATAPPVSAADQTTAAGKVTRSDDAATTQKSDDVQRQLERTAELIRKGDPSAAVPGYVSRDVEGWPVRVSESLLTEHPEQTTRAIELLAAQLRKVKDVLPAGPLAHVKTVPIWLSPEYEGKRPTGEYHPGAGWLKEQGRRPELVKCVEFSNTAIFDREIQRMPVMVLHELAHAYHDQVLGFDNAKVKAAYEKAKSNGIYDSVQRGNGRKERAYAMTTPMEYFAEQSEAYFGINDFYPFNKAELEQHDPEMAMLLGRLWRVGD